MAVQPCVEWISQNNNNNNNNKIWINPVRLQFSLYLYLILYQEGNFAQAHTLLEYMA